MAWIESHQTLARHPKTLALAAILRTSKPAAIGHLHLLWWWALDYAANGDLSRFDDRTIADAAEWRKDPPAFVEALRVAGWLNGDGTVHDWYDYAGRLVQQRAAKRESMRQARARTVSARSGNVLDTVRPTVPDPTQPTEPDRTEPDLNLAPTRRDEVFEALAEACDIDWHHLTPTARGALNAAVKALREAGDATPEEVGFRVRAYRLSYPTVALTPSAIAKHWPSLANGARGGRALSTADRLLIQSREMQQREEAERGTVASG